MVYSNAVMDVLNFVLCNFYYMYHEQTNAHLIDSLLYCSLFIYEAINKEKYNKLSIKCALLRSLYEYIHHN